MNKKARLTRPFKIRYKLLSSYFKSSWSLADYPLEYRQQEMLDLSGTHLTICTSQKDMSYQDLEQK
jgi:hypothetical protein